MFDFDGKLKKQMDIASKDEKQKLAFEKEQAANEYKDGTNVLDAYRFFNSFIKDAYPNFVNLLIESNRDNLYVHKNSIEDVILSGEFRFAFWEKSYYKYDKKVILSSTFTANSDCFVELKKMLEKFLERNNIGRLITFDDGYGCIIDFSGTFDQLKNAYLMELQLLEKTYADLAAANEYKSNAFDFDQIIDSQRETAKKLLSDKIKLNNAAQKGSTSLELYKLFIENIYPVLFKELIKEATFGQVNRLPANQDGFSIIDKENINGFNLYKKLYFRHSTFGGDPYIYYNGTNEIIINADKETLDELLEKYFSDFCKRHNWGHYYKTEGYPFIMSFEGHCQDLKDWYLEERKKIAENLAAMSQNPNSFSRK